MGRRKDKIMLSKSYRTAFDTLTDEQAGQMIKAVFAYDAGEEVDLDGALQMAWLFVKAGLDEEREQMEEISRINAENGRRGGRPRTSQRETPQPETRRRAEYPEGFNAFWEAYPLKKDKGAAYEKYKARVNDGYSPEELLESAKAYAEECKRDHRDPKYIKHAKTFLGPAMPFADYIQHGTAPVDDGYGEVDFSRI